MQMYYLVKINGILYSYRHEKVKHSPCFCMLTLDKGSKAGHIPRMLINELLVQIKIGRNYHLFKEITG